MPDERWWPNMALHIFQDRYGGWRARVEMRLGGSDRLFYVPPREEVGSSTRVVLLLRVETVLDDIGVLYGLDPFNAPGILELRRACEQRDQARLEAAVLRDHLEVARAERDALARQIAAARERIEAIARGEP